MFKSRTEEIIDRLKAEDKVYTLSDDEMLSISNHIYESMENFKQELYKKFKQSEKDLHKVILNA